jgi:hypothetical protein
LWFVTDIEKYELVDVKLTFQISTFKCQQQQNVKHQTEEELQSDLCMTFRFLKKVKMKLQFYTEIFTKINFFYNRQKTRHLCIIIKSQNF